MDLPLFPDPAIVSRYQGRSLDVVEIQGILPHRPPFLLIDRVVELEPAVRAVGHKCVTANEWFFAGHYPGFPVMPGVLIVEAAAQLGGIVVMTGFDAEAWVPLFTGIEKAKFRRPVRPGDLLVLTSEVVTVRPRFGKMMAVMRMQGQVDGQLAMDTTCNFALVNDLT